jgi:hypothetical protein
LQITDFLFFSGFARKSQGNDALAKNLGGQVIGESILKTFIVEKLMRIKGLSFFS